MSFLKTFSTFTCTWTILIFLLYLTKTVQLKSINNLIFRGLDANKGDAPFQVQLFYENIFLCGGVIIKSNWVLTAAHCTEKIQDVKRGHVVGGQLELLGSGPSQDPSNQIRQISRFINHPSYNSITAENDISLIYLSEGFILNEYVNTAPLPSQNDLVSTQGSSAVVFGWGQNELEGGRPTVKMQKLGVNILSGSHCRVFNYFSENIKICAEGRDGGGVCPGDSGGPLICPDPSPPYFYVCGLVSYKNSGCGVNIYPSVYTRVSYFLNWISQSIDNDSAAKKERKENPGGQTSCNFNHDCGFLSVCSEQKYCQSVFSPSISSTTNRPPTTTQYPSFSFPDMEKRKEIPGGLITCNYNHDCGFLSVCSEYKYCQSVFALPSHTTNRPPTTQEFAPSYFMEYHQERPDHSCSDDYDCGIYRSCSEHKFCQSSFSLISSTNSPSPDYFVHRKEIIPDYTCNNDYDCGFLRRCPEYNFCENIISYY